MKYDKLYHTVKLLFILNHFLQLLTFVTCQNTQKLRNFLQQSLQLFMSFMVSFNVWSITYGITDTVTTTIIESVVIL